MRCLLIVCCVAVALAAEDSGWWGDSGGESGTDEPSPSPSPTTAAPPSSSVAPTTTGGGETTSQQPSGDVPCGTPSDKYPPNVVVGSDGKLQEVQSIVGGKEAARHGFPWATAFLFEGGQGCGAALVNKQWIVTASHCLFNNDGSRVSADIMSFAFGAHNLALAESSRVVRKAAKVIPHPQYDSESMANDIALIKLDKEVAYTDEIRPICLPSKTDSFQVDGDNVLVSGWGLTQDGGSQSSTLLQVMVKAQTNEKCKQAGGNYASITADQMCAAADGKDSCQGDSGGPLVSVNTDKKFVLAGVVSWGMGCAKAGSPGVYSHVPHNVEWLHKTMSEN